MDMFPMAIKASGKLSVLIKSPGVLLPITKEIYAPTLKELGEHGIKFAEKEEEFVS